MWQCERALRGALLDFPCRGTDADRGSGWVNVSTRGTLSQVYATGSTINDGSVNKSKWKRYGRLWVEGRYRGGVTAFIR